MLFALVCSQYQYLLSMSVKLIPSLIKKVSVKGGWQCIFNAIAVQMIFLCLVGLSLEWELFPVVLFIITCHAQKVKQVLNLPAVCSS